MTQFNVSALPTLLLLVPLGAGVASAQVETPARPSACGKPSYVLQVNANQRQTPMTINLNGKAVGPGKTSGSIKENVTAAIQEQNRIQVDWQAKEPSPFGGVFSVPVTLKVLYGSRATTLFKFDPRTYPNQRQVAVKFAAPPQDNLACDKNLYMAKLAFSNAFGPFEWTIAVDGKYYVYVLGDAEVNLRPFLQKGANKVTLSWRVIGGSGKNNLSNHDVAQIFSTVNGKTRSLLTFGFKNTVGTSGSKSVTINVP